MSFFISQPKRSPNMFPLLLSAVSSPVARRMIFRCRLIGLVLLCAPVAWAGPHEHGVVYLDLAREGATLTAHLRAPLHSLVGFERPPRNAAERKAAHDLLEHLRQDRSVLLTEAAAGCQLQSVDIRADVLEGVARKAGDGHAELQADYRWVCTKPDQLRSATVQLFERYRHTRKIEVQIAIPQGQSRASLSAASRTVSLGR